ncbi:Retrovirus-related Pol polyprotein from type-1 retrotransposable element [Trichinella sp. T8]|nr:Retrovirus-related Pol polyprotein from type-1 retrotransposable element [Trichinella sp. T8]
MHDSAHTKHACSVCSRSFTTFTGLRLHEKRAHPATLAASSQKSIKHQWTIDHLRETKEMKDQPTASNSCSLKSFAEALSSKWSEAISIDMAKYLRKKLRRVDLNLSALNADTIDGDISGLLPDVVEKSIDLECVGSINRATSIGEEINGVGVLSTCDTSGFRVETIGQTTPSPNKHRPGRDLRHHLEDSLTSCNSELEGLLNFIVNKVLNSGIEDRNKHVDAALSVLIEFLCEPKEYSGPNFPGGGYAAPPKMKIHTSAGPDGIKVSHLRSCDSVCLAKAFNLFLLARHIPQQLKDCRTTLIPKTDDPRPDAEDYRPITVASCLYRLFSIIETRRLEDSLSLHPRQKAFRSGTDGAFDNTSTLMTVIREAHNCGKELNIVSIDLVKAFDTVNHTSITRALRMHGLDDESRTLITEMVTGSSTIIKGDGGALSNRIEINQGVRQGDPISPLPSVRPDETTMKRNHEPKPRGSQTVRLIAAGTFIGERPANSENSQMPCHLISDATCGFSFATFSGLHLHRKRAHPDVFAAACGGLGWTHLRKFDTFL